MPYLEQQIQKELDEKLIGPAHARMLQHVKNLAKLSRNKISQYYTKWDAYDMTYRGLIPADRHDREARERKEPERYIVPTTFAQVQTFVSFVFQLMTQRPEFFELTGTGTEDYRRAQLLEKLLAYNLDKNTFEKILYQLLLDAAKYGICITKHGWAEEYIHVERGVQEAPAIPIAGGIMGVGTPADMKAASEVASYVGNRIWSISPYRWLPDPRLPINRFHEGEFCGSENEFGRVTLRERPDLKGVQWVPRFTKQYMEDRGTTRYMFPEVADQLVGSKAATEAPVVLTEIQVKITPANFGLNVGQDYQSTDGETKLGPEKYPVLYVVEYANDQRILKFERMGYAHNRFTYDAAEIMPDQNNMINSGYAEIIDPQQNIINFYINSHVTSVRKNLRNMFVVDPSAIEMKDFDSRAPIIRLKSTAYRSGVDRWVKQLQVTDVTGNHMKDAEAINQMIQYTTGINENALGQYASGRRPAREVSAVNSAASMRLKTPASLIYVNLLEPMARKLISNIRDGIDEDTFHKVCGDTGDPNDFLLVKSSDGLAALDYDFQIFDTTLPSEKGQQAAAMQELILGMIQGGPEVMAMFGYTPEDMKVLMETMMKLRGIPLPPRAGQGLNPPGVMIPPGMSVPPPPPPDPMQMMAQMVQRGMQPGANGGGGPPMPPNGAPNPLAALMGGGQ